MATSGNTSVSVGSGCTLKFNWSQSSQSVANNTTKISWNMQVILSSGYSISSSAGKNWSVTVNGTKYSGTNSFGNISGTTKTLASGSTTITHNSDGNKTFSYSFSQEFAITYNGKSLKTISGSGSGTLNTIARASSFTLSSSSLDMGASQTVNITRASSSFTHTIQYTFGGTTTTSHTKTGSTSVSFTPSLNLANKIPNATSGTCTVKVTTYSGDTSIGSASKTFTLKVPSSVKPTIPTMSLTCNGGLNGLSIAGKSTITATASASGSQGSSISSYTWSGAGLSGTGSSKTTGTLSAGTYTITVTAKDSRGRTNAVSANFTVYAYSAPTCSISAYRTDSNGNANASGEYVRLKLGWNLSNPNNANTNAHTYKVEYKTSSASSWTQTNSGTLSPSYSASNVVYNPNSVKVSKTTSYSFRFTVTDSFGSKSATCTLSTISAVFNVEKNGVGIGKIYERGKLDVGGDAYSARFIANGNGKNAVVGTGASDIYLHNSASGKYLQLRDDGTLTYSGSPIVMGSKTASGNRWDVVATVAGDGVMEVGKYIDFHETDGDTSDYAARLYHNKDGWLATQKFDVSYWGFAPLHVTRNDGSTNAAAMGFSNGNGVLGYIGMKGGVNSGLYRYSADTNSSYRILDSNGNQTITGSLKTGEYTNAYRGVTFKRKTDKVGNYLGKIGCSVINSTEPTVTIEIGKIADTSNDSFADGFRRFSFGTSHFLVHANNAVDIGSSNFRFKAVYATNGTIQTSDGRYKYILEDVDSGVCYELIKDMNLYGYSTLNKRIDEYVDTTEISDELQQSSQEDMNLHMGFVAQEIEDSELAKYILIKDELEDEDGNKTGEYIYSVDNYAYTTAIHGALIHEIELRDKQIEELQEENKELEERLAKIEELLGVK